MITIHKYPLVLKDHQVIEAPVGARPLSLMLDPVGTPCLWMMVDDQKITKKIEVFIVGTGNPLPNEPMKHFGSFVKGAFVWHVFLKT